MSRLIVYGAPFPARQCSGCDAGRKLLRQLQEWLMSGARTDARGLDAFTLTAVATELRRLERELLGGNER